MNREEAKALFRKNKDAYGKPKGVMGKIDKIFDEWEAEEKLLTQRLGKMLLDIAVDTENQIKNTCEFWGVDDCVIDDLKTNVALAFDQNKEKYTHVAVGHHLPKDYVEK